MDDLMIFDEKAKRKMGLICFIPVLCFFLCFIYYLILTLPLTQGHQQPASIVGLFSRNYDTLLIILAASAVITAPVFIYCLIVLARIKNISSGNKVLWIVFLSFLAPVASALFWIFVIKGLPKYTRIYPDIA